MIVREIARSPEVQERIGELVKPIAAIQRIIARGQERGEFRPDFDPRLAGILFYGGIEEMLSGWVLGQIADRDDVAADAERMLVDVFCAGLSRRCVRQAAPRRPPLRSAR